MTEPADATTYERELLRCPNCDTALKTVDSLEHVDEGIVTGTIACPNEDCDFAAREEWVIDRTVRLDEADTTDANEASPA